MTNLMHWSFCYLHTNDGFGNISNYHAQQLRSKLFLSFSSFKLFDIPHYVKFNKNQLLLSQTVIWNSMWFFFSITAPSLRSRFPTPHNLIEFQCDSNYYGRKNQFVYGAEFSFPNLIMKMLFIFQWENSNGIAINQTYSLWKLTVDKYWFRVKGILAWVENSIWLIRIAFHLLIILGNAEESNLFSSLFNFVLLLSSFSENSQLDDLYTRYRKRLRKSLFISGLGISLVSCLISIILCCVGSQVNSFFSSLSQSFKFPVEKFM